MFAQSNTPLWVLYGGYQYARIDSGFIDDELRLYQTTHPTFPVPTFGKHQNLNGWNFGVQENVNSWFGGVVDVSGSYGTKKLDVTALEAMQGVSIPNVSFIDRTRLRVFTFMGGPQFTLRKSANFQPFARALVGGIFSRNSENLLGNNVPQFSEFHFNDEGFAFGGGGGIDFFFTHRAGLRVAMDYVRSNLFNATQDNLRGTAGLVFRFRSK